jgi:protease-4
MKQFFKVVFASMLGFILANILLLFLFIAIVGGIAASSGSKKTAEIDDNSILKIEFSGPISDRSDNNPFKNFNPLSGENKQGYGLTDILDALEKAKTDDKIKGIYMHFDGVPAGMATTEEIRNALLDFKKSGKFILSYSNTYDQKAYYLSSVADSIMVHPEGGLDFRGLSASVMFLKGAMEKLEVEPQIIRHGKFKSAIEPLILDKMSDANREQTSTYLNALWNRMLDGISAARKISVQELTAMADQALIRNPKDALKYKLVDKLAYEDEVQASLRKRLGIEEKDKIKFVSLGKYFETPSAEETAKEKVAIIYASGDIVDGEGSDDNVGGDKIAATIRKARLDEKVKAIVLRVNSPGGSALASDIMWREVILAKKVKPVVVSMGDVAASGGYYISCAADRIFASPNTITGSIGVFGVLINTKKLFNNKLGITIDTVKTNKFADMGASYRPLTDTERDIIQQGVEEVYQTFITHVGEGRKMPTANVDSIGQGRVWAGTDAKRINLIDEFGGLKDAIAYAAKKANLEKYRVVGYPEQEEPFKKFMKQVSGEGEEALIKAQLGNNYDYYKKIKRALQIEGIQARIPYELEVY